MQLRPCVAPLYSDQVYVYVYIYIRNNKIEAPTLPNLKKIDANLTKQRAKHDNKANNIYSHKYLVTGCIVLL